MRKQARSTRVKGLLYALAASLLVAAAILVLTRSTSHSAANAAHMHLPESAATESPPKVAAVPPAPLRFTGSPGPLPAAPVPSRSPAASFIGEEMTNERRATYLADTFQSQGTDLGWARATQGALREELATLEGANVTVESVECRETLCRVTATFASQQDRRAFVRQGFLMGSQSATYAQNMAVFSPPPEVVGRDNLRGVVYLMRNETN